MRKGKREREQLRQDYALVKEAKRLVIAANLAAPKVQSLAPAKLGFRVTPDLRQGYAFNNPSNLGRQSRFGMDGTDYRNNKAPRLPAGTGSYRK